MNFNPLLINWIKARSSLINYQTVRWRRIRKPFWVGVAKSKMFNIPQSFKKYTEVEFKELNRLKRDYNTHNRSLMNFIRHNDPRLADIIISDEKILSDLDEEIQKSLKKNDLWNAECAKNREERLEKVTKDEVDYIIKHIELKQAEEKKVMERIEEVVRIEKELSKTYITPENIDEAIDKCLANVVEYDFAIDIKGNKYYGRETLDPRSGKNKKMEADAAG